MLLPLMVAVAVPPTILNMLSMRRSLVPAVPVANTGAVANGNELPQSEETCHAANQLFMPMITLTVRVAVAVPLSLVAE